MKKGSVVGLLLFMINGVLFSQNFTSKDVIGKWQPNYIVYKTDTLVLGDKDKAKSFFAKIANDNKPGLTGEDRTRNVMVTSLGFGFAALMKYEFKEGNEFWSIMDFKGETKSSKMGSYSISGNKLKLNPDKADLKNTYYFIESAGGIVSLKTEIEGAYLYLTKF
ncbi:MAG: hypothetical protein ACO3EE_06325 [Flavobacteriales bacterium]